MVCGRLLQVLEETDSTFRIIAPIHLLSDMEGLQLLVSPEEERGPENTGCSQKIAVTWTTGLSRPQAIQANCGGRDSMWSLWQVPNSRIIT